MHSVSSCALAALLTGLAPVAHAQTTFGLGLLVGGNAASARYGESTYPVQEVLVPKGRFYTLSS